MITYNKLIRDNIIEKIEATWWTANYHIATPEEFEIKLKEKLIEEAKELAAEHNIEDIKNELADVLRVTQEIMKLYAITQEDIKDAIEKKDKKAWGFDQRIILDQASEF